MADIIKILNNEKIEKIEEDLIAYKVSKKTNDVIKYELDQNTNSMTVQKLISIKNVLLYKMKESINYREMQFYLEVKDYTFLYTFKNKNQKENNIISDNIVELLRILKEYSQSVIRENENINLSTCTNIRNALKNIDVIIKLGSYLSQYSTQIKQHLKGIKYSEAITNVVIDIINASGNYNESIVEFNEKLSNNHLILNKQNDSEPIENGTLNKLRSIELVKCIDEIDGEKEKDTRYYDKSSGNWSTRRYNVINTIINIMNMIYLNVKLDELLQDYFFINQNDILKYYFEDDRTIGYEDIYNYYLEYEEKLEKYEKGTRKVEIYKKVSEIKNKILLKSPCYTLFNINIQELTKLLNLVRDEGLYEEVLSIKKELQNSQRILRSKWDEFNKKLTTYIDVIKKEEPYYGTQLNTVKEKLFKQDLNITRAKMVKEICDEEEIKILKAEYEALILVAKSIFELELEIRTGAE